MRCAQIREGLSARLDGEDPGLDPAELAAHLAGCPACTAHAAELDALHRAVRVREAEPVPDLTAAILAQAPALGGTAPARRADAPAAPWWAIGRERISTARWALLTVALTQLVLAGPALLQRSGAEHVSRELGAFDVALAVGLLVAAWQPWRAWGLLPAGLALGLVLAVTAIADVLTGNAEALGEAHHVLDLAGMVLLWLVAREARDLSRQAPARPPALPTA